jgi:hypothetical protein
MLRRLPPNIGGEKQGISQTVVQLITCGGVARVFTHPHFQRIEKWRGC